MRSALLLGLLLLLAAGPAAAAGRKAAPGDYDYYLLALSWSPGWCAAEPERRQRHPDQCAAPSGFIVHGLWPQWRDGGWPQFCRRESGVPAAVRRQAMAFTPDRRLIEHQWNKHGSCTTLDAAGYFARAGDAFAGVAIPELLQAPPKRLRLDVATIERLFAEANPGLAPGMLAVTCGKAPEVRICLDRDLGFTACGAGVAHRCRSVTLEPGW